MFCDSDYSLYLVKLKLSVFDIQRKLFLYKNAWNKRSEKTTPLLQPSIEVVNCPEPNCIIQKKRFKMKYHFSKLASFDEHGKPHTPGSKKFSKLCKPSKEHTKYFYEKKYDINTSLGTIFPGSKFSHAPKMNPFKIR